MKHPRRVDLWAGTLLVSFACGGVAQDKPGVAEKSKQQANAVQESPARRQQTLSEFVMRRAAVRAIFAGATKVESFRLVAGGGGKPLGRIQKWTYFAKGVPQGAWFAAKLSKIVLDPQIFTLQAGSRKHCMFAPGVAFRVWNQTQYVDVVICFTCNEAMIFENRQEATGFSKYQSTEPVMQGDIDLVRPALVALTKEALPADPVFSKLEEQKPRSTRENKRE